MLQENNEAESSCLLTCTSQQIYCNQSPVRERVKTNKFLFETVTRYVIEEEIANRTHTHGK